METNRTEGFLCKSLGVFDGLDENGAIFRRENRKSSPTTIKFAGVPLDDDDEDPHDDFWGFPRDVWLDDRKPDLLDFDAQKRNVLIRHDFPKDSPEIREDLLSPEREALVNIPLSPETQKKNELCSYLQLMNMNNTDKKTVSAIQNRRSNRVKNLKIMIEKRNLERKLLVEFKESLERKSFDELGLVIKENYEITNPVQKINFNVELIPENLLSEVSNFDDSIMKVIGKDIKKKIQDERKNNNNLKENKKSSKKPPDVVSVNKSKMETSRLMLRKNKINKSLRSSINLNEVGIKTLTLNERKIRSLRSSVNLNNVGIKALTINEKKIKQLMNRKRIEMRKKFISKSILNKENTRRINVKIKMNNERINNEKLRILRKRENVKKSRIVTKKQRHDKKRDSKSEDNFNLRETRNSKQIKIQMENEALLTKTKSDNTKEASHRKTVESIEQKDIPNEAVAPHKSPSILEQYLQRNTQAPSPKSIKKEPEFNHILTVSISTIFEDKITTDTENPIKTDCKNTKPAENKNLGKSFEINSGMIPLKKRKILPPVEDTEVREALLVNSSDVDPPNRKENLVNGQKVDVSPKAPSDAVSSLLKATTEISKFVFREDKSENLTKSPNSFNVVDLSQSAWVSNSPNSNLYAYNCWQEHNYMKHPELDIAPFNKEMFLIDSSSCSEFSNDEKDFLKESYKEIPRINSVPPTDIFEPKTEITSLEKSPKTPSKSKKNLHKLLMRNSSDTVETFSSNENCFDDRISTNSIKIDFTKGKILNAYYLGYNLVVTQEQLISFWTQSPLGNMLGVHNLWVSKGQIQRLPLDGNYICKQSREVVVNLENKSCAYIELWMKEHKSDKRELPLADVFATVYFWTSQNAVGLNKKLLQLANIKGNIKDVQYVVLRTARKIIVSWVEIQNTSLSTVIACYDLSPDYQTVVSVLEMTSVNHYVESLHTLGDCCDAVVGFGENHVTIWELEYGEVFETIEISQRYNEPRVLWLERDRGLLFFMQYHKLERLVMLIAINGYSKESKKMQVFRIPTGYDVLKGLCVDNNMLGAVFKNGLICWNIKTGDEIIAELSSHPYLIPSNKHLIEIKSNTVEVTHFQSYFLTNFDLQL